MKELKKCRSAVDMVSVSFEFFRRHYAPILKDIFLYVAPLMLVSHFILFRMAGALLGRSLWGGYFSQTLQQYHLPADNVVFWLVFSVFQLISFLFLYYIVNEYVFQAVENPDKKPLSPFQPSRFGQRIWGHAGVMVVYLLAFTLLILTLYVIPSGFISFLVFLFMLFLLVKYSLAFPAISIENKGVLESFQRSSDLVKSMWWRSFWFYFITSWVVYFIGMALIAPFLLGMQAVEYLNLPIAQGEPGSWVFLIFIFLFYLFASLIMSAFFVLSLAVNFYSLKDKHEETFLEEKIHEVETE